MISLGKVRRLRLAALLIYSFTIALVLLLVAKVKRNKDSSMIALSVYEKNKILLNESEEWNNLYLPIGGARFDKRRLLRIHDFIRTGNEWEDLMEQFDVCLTTQTSIERIYWLPEVIENWNGPVSLAVFIANEKEWIILNLYMVFLERCYSNFRDHVSIHLAVPVYLSPFFIDQEKMKDYNITQLIRTAAKAECFDGEGFLKILLDSFSVPNHNEKDKLARKVKYPQNHMRNIARQTCATDWTFATDVDIIPRTRMAEMLQEFYEFIHKNSKYCKKCAYVIPTFEVHETQTFPNSKAELIDYYYSGAARQYHIVDYDKAQNATDYLRWIKTNVDDDEITRISHQILKAERQIQYYEPFYVSSDRIPPFDERFLGYGFTRSSQFQEAHMAGWNFSVLSTVYSIHWTNFQAPPPVPPKNSKKKVTVAERIRFNQTMENRILFIKFMKELKLKMREGIL